MTKIKNYKDNHAISHAWAYASKEEAGKTSNQSFTFYGAQLHSYNTAIAQKYEVSIKGEKSVICVHNSTSYSVTTSRHQSLARMAFSGKALHLKNCPRGFRFERNEILLALHNSYADARDSLKAAKRESTRMKALHEFHVVKENLNQLLNYKILEKKDLVIFGALKMLLKTEVDAAFQEKIVKQQKAQDRAEKLKQKKRLKELEPIILEKIQEFRTGKRQYLGHDERAFVGNSDLIRLDKKEKRIVTSQSVKMPLVVALGLYFEARKAFETKNPSTKKLKLLDYSVESIDAKGNAKVGCHYFKFEEMARCYKDEYLPTLPN